MTKSHLSFAFAAFLSVLLFGLTSCTPVEPAFDEAAEREIILQLHEE